MANGRAAAVEQLQWYLGRLADPGDVDLAELEPRFDTSGFTGNWSLDGELRRLRGDHSVVLPFTVESVDASSDDVANAVIVAGDDKRWALTAWTDGDGGRLTGVRTVVAPPPGTVVRDA